MKRKLLYVAGFIFIVLSFNSCDALKNCKVCKQVTYISGTLDHEGSESEYCDADLIRVQATPDVVIGPSVTKWECH